MHFLRGKSLPDIYFKTPWYTIKKGKGLPCVSFKKGKRLDDNHIHLSDVSIQSYGFALKEDSMIESASH